MIKLGETSIRVPAAEDHFRLVAIHLLSHGAWRPLWLCDIAAMLEDLPQDFNWGRCLGTNLASPAGSAPLLNLRIVCLEPALIACRPAVVFNGYQNGLPGLSSMSGRHQLLLGTAVPRSLSHWRTRNVWSIPGSWWWK